jgi:hypothetical protein
MSATVRDNYFAAAAAAPACADARAWASTVPLATLAFTTLCTVRARARVVESCLVAAACCNCRRVCECVRMRGTPLSARACVRPLVSLTRGAGIWCFVCSKRGVVEWAAMGLGVSVPGVAWGELD